MLARQWHDFRLANSPISFRGTLPETYKHKECRDTVRKLSRQRLERNAHALPVGRQCAATVFFGGSRVAMACRFRKTCQRSSNVNIKNHVISEEGLDAYYQKEVARRLCSCNMLQLYGRAVCKTYCILSKTSKNICLGIFTPYVIMWRPKKQQYHVAVYLRHPVSTFYTQSGTMI